MKFWPLVTRSFRKSAWARWAVCAQGRTVLFVSHNMLAVDGLCTRAICLHDGKAVLEGPPAFSHFALPAELAAEVFKEVVYDDIETAPGNDMIRLHRVWVRPQNGTRWIAHRSHPLCGGVRVLEARGRMRVGPGGGSFNEHGVTVFTTASLGELS